MSIRELSRTIQGMPTSDGAGVRLTRSLGGLPGARVDPFLMLDEFSSDDAADYIAGFPAHPHRGFETVTYMIEGHMLHEDHLGNRGDLRSGGVQWMTAGRGIVHSEMPQQTEGRMRGFQLWINLPAAEKMCPADYRDIQAEEIPVVDLTDGGRIRVVAGSPEIGGRRVDGPVSPRSTEPVYLDVSLSAGAVLEQPLPAGHNALLYPFEGGVTVGPEGGGKTLPRGHAGVLGAGGAVRVRAGADGARLLLLAGRPIGEPVVQHGPFVMNTREEIEQALRDYAEGRLTAA